LQRYFIQLSFKGTSFHGWQIQDNALSVQEVLNQALSHHIKETITTTGAGRTDTGVHAEKYFAHFDAKKGVLKDKDLIHKVNKLLPPDIAIQHIFEVHNEAHARYHAISRTYQYRIHTKKDPFITETSYYVYGKLNVELMNEAATILLKHKDFSAFSKSGTQVKTNICDLTQAKFTVTGDHLLFTITADRFLRNMVRAIVGTLIEVGRNKITLKEFIKIIEQKKRAAAGFSVPACGLSLTEIVYNQDKLKI
jgi:tRNA pseudouridine38-40 synthase